MVPIQNIRKPIKVLAAMALALTMSVGLFSPISPAAAQQAPAAAPAPEPAFVDVVNTDPVAGAAEGRTTGTRAYGASLWYATLSKWTTGKTMGVAVDHAKFCVWPAPCVTVPSGAGFDVYRYIRNLLWEVYKGNGGHIRPIQDLMWKGGSPFLTDRCLKVGPSSYCVSAQKQREYMFRWIYDDTALDSSAANGIRESLRAAQQQYGCMKLKVIRESNWTVDSNKDSDCKMGGLSLP